MTAITQSSYLIGLVVLIFNAISPIASALTEPPVLESPDSLSLVVMKMTGDEYVMIKNNSPTAISDLSHFSLKAFNNFNPLTNNVSVTTQILPAVGLGQGETLLLSSTIRPTCGASLAGKLSISLVDGSGRLEIVQAPNFGTSNLPEVVDSVSWSSTTAAEIKSVPSNTKVPLAAYYRMSFNGTFSWQLAELDSITPCQLNVVMPGASGNNAVIISPEASAASSGVTVAVVSGETSPPEADSNLSAIQITELLPNPSGTGNDMTDEYIELYNPNDSDIELSGHQLQTGISKLYNFTFKPGTILTAGSYKSFHSSVTGLTLSNTLGQARLLSPSGESVSATDVYRTAKDGLSWSLVDETWNWSEVPTPNGLNVLRIPTPAGTKAAPIKSSLIKKSTRETAAKKPKAPKVPKPAKPKKIKVEKTTNYSSALDKTLMERPIQTKLVATVGSLAVLYGAYEYRSSLANGFYKLRRKLGFSHADRG